MDKIDSCLNWLNKKYGDLKSISKLDVIYYVDKQNNPLFYYHSDDKNGIIYVSNRKHLKSMVR